VRLAIQPMVLAGVVATAAAGLLPPMGGNADAQDNSMFPMPSGRYYNPYAYGPAGSYTQRYGGAFSPGASNMFSRGPVPYSPPAYAPGAGVNLYPNRPYGGTFYFRPMVGPAYDPFRNGR
jgi:hypothetical protein